MRIARKLMLLALTAIAAMAFAASTASAQTVEILQEHTGNHCATLPSGGCDIEGHGELILRGHLFGIESTVSDCIVDLSGEVNEDGEGRVQAITLNDHPGINDCVRLPCASSLPWHVDLAEGGGSTETITAEYCVDQDTPPVNDGDENKCLATGPVNTTGDHAYEVDYADTGTAHLGLDCELVGELHLEDGDNGTANDKSTETDTTHEIEIVHTP